jgi:hypothetical protein
MDLSSAMEKSRVLVGVFRQELVVVSLCTFFGVGLDI